MGPSRRDCGMGLLRVADKRLHALRGVCSKAMHTLRLRSVRTNHREAIVHPSEGGLTSIADREKVDEGERHGCVMAKCGLAG